MYKKISIAVALVAVLVFGINTVHTLAKEQHSPKDYKCRWDKNDKVQNYEKGRTDSCPDDCKCGPDIDCKDQGCEKPKVNKCICK